MITTIDLLNAYKVRHCCASNRALARKMGLSQGLIQQCYNRGSLSVDRALDMGIELGFNLEQVLIGNLCEKTSITQRARLILAKLINEEIGIKPDKIDRILRDVNKPKSVNNFTSKLSTSEFVKRA